MADFSKPLASIDDWVAAGAVRGASAAVWHKGEIVATHVAGEARKGQAVTNDTLFALASVSKPMTAAAILRAVDNGDFTLDTPVSALVPEFGEVADPLGDDVVPQLEALRDRVSMRQLLSHTSGLPENVGAKRIRMRDQPSLDAIVDAMCGLPLQAAPGSTLRYSNCGIAIAARALENTTGKSFHAFLQGSVLDPLNLADIAIRPDETWDDRIAHTEDAAFAGTPAESYNTPYWRGLGIPWGGYFGTPTDVARFAASFLQESHSPLSWEARHEMTIDQTGRVPGGVDSAGVKWAHGAWGLGWEVSVDKRNHWTGTLRSPSTFCHWGNSGTLVWTDPERSLVLAVFGNRTVITPWPFKPARWSELSDAVVRAADES